MLMAKRLFMRLLLIGSELWVSKWRWSRIWVYIEIGHVLCYNMILMFQVIIYSIFSESEG
jgi:hypothetical protein